LISYQRPLETARLIQEPFHQGGHCSALRARPNSRMRLNGDYARDGSALVQGLLSEDVCGFILAQLRSDLDRAGRRIEDMALDSGLVDRPTSEIYGYGYPPLLTLLWGLSPAMEQLIGTSLVPTYSYLRIYRKGDICRVHSDRQSCEHSASVTLMYSDGLTWDLEVGTDPVAPLNGRTSDDFQGEGSRALSMAPGDAVLYNGVTRRHGRTAPNPNRWSAHLFCHWVERDGRFSEFAYDRRQATFANSAFDFA